MLTKIIFLFSTFLFPCFLYSSIAQSNLGTKKMSHHENKMWFEPISKSIKKIIGYRSFLRNGDTIRDKSLELIYDTNGNLVEEQDFFSKSLTKKKYDSINRLMYYKFYTVFEDKEILVSSTIYSYYTEYEILQKEFISLDTVVIETDTKDKQIREELIYQSKPNKKRIRTKKQIRNKYLDFGEGQKMPVSFSVEKMDSLNEEREYDFYSEGNNKGKLKIIRTISEEKNKEKRIIEENYSYPSENSILVSFKQNGTQIYKYQFIYQDEKLICVNYYSIIELDKIDKWIEYEYIFY